MTIYDINHIMIDKKVIMRGGSQMVNLKHTVENAGDKVAGKVKETVGKATGNSEMELKGKVQSAKADIKGKVQNITDK